MSASALLDSLINDAHRNGKLETMQALQLLRDPVAQLEARVAEASQPAEAAAPSADRGFRHQRTEIDDATGHLEKALADLWEEQNRPNSALNYGLGLLQDLLVTGTSRAFSLLPRGEVLHRVTSDERRVVATVIQWLGTNCGRGFLYEAFRRAAWKIEMKPQP